MARAVEQTGHLAIQCSNGKRALDTLMDNLDIDMVITDVMMPEVTGRELVQILRGNQLFADLPILIISSVVEQSQIEDLLALGEAQFLVKPLNLATLKTLVTQTATTRAAAGEAWKLRKIA